ncbi:hypothetical protein K474DRAFT_1503445 [Panus rudis PR-1116 ss-1]|nr:hypothetical protein K474DRAFT_1503445 [Panus rudis PR-1116 ss-1]
MRGIAHTLLSLPSISLARFLKTYWTPCFLPADGVLRPRTDEDLTQEQRGWSQIRNRGRANHFLAVIFSGTAGPNTTPLGWSTSIGDQNGPRQARKGAFRDLSSVASGNIGDLKVTKGRRRGGPYVPTQHNLPAFPSGLKACQNKRDLTVRPQSAV